MQPLWIELSETVDTLKLAQQALQHHISIALGVIFSANQKYHPCIRLNGALPWTEKIESAQKKLGQLCNMLK